MEPSHVHRTWYGVAWKKSEYSNNMIEKAGRAIANGDYTKMSRDDALTVVNNWRAAHAYPMQVFYMNCTRKAKYFPNALVVQRLKRLSSIVGKLARFPEMSLMRMQDLGGCRVIVENPSEVYRFTSSIKYSSIKHQLDKEYDYIATPKSSGYRSVHLVYKYFSDKKSDYNGFKIEIQIRTRLQHLWATAIEVLSLYTENNLKASQGDNRILRYMELISALFAIEEGSPTSNNVPSSKEEIFTEIKSLSSIMVPQMLEAAKITLDYTGRVAKKSRRIGFYILSIDQVNSSLKINSYKFSEFDTATRDYELLERQENINAVLVSASNIDALRKAYPNYFADISEFRKKLAEIVLMM